MGILRLGTGIKSGAGVYPWDLFNSVHAWIAEPQFIQLDGSNRVESWIAQKSTVDGAALSQSTADDRPFYEPSSFNNTPTIYFDGINDNLWTQQSGIYSLANGTDAPLAVISLWEPITHASGSQFWAFANTAATDPFFRLIRASVGWRIDKEDDAGTNDTTIVNNLGNVPTNTITLTTVRHEGVSTHIYHDGVEHVNSPEDLDVGAITEMDNLTLAAWRNNSSTAVNFTEVRISGFWIVENDDTAAIDAITTWALNRGGL